MEFSLVLLHQSVRTNRPQAHSETWLSQSASLCTRRA